MGVLSICDMVFDEGCEYNFGVPRMLTYSGSYLHKPGDPNPVRTNKTPNDAQDPKTKQAGALAEEAKQRRLNYSYTSQLCFCVASSWVESRKQ
eukprot:6407641-Amphidinium_carterae.1